MNDYKRIIRLQREQIRLLRESRDLHARRAEIQDDRHRMAEWREGYWLQLLCLCVVIASSGLLGEITPEVTK